MNDISDHWIDIGKIVFAFILTSGVGTWIAAYLQRRTWEHQRLVKLRDEERQQAFAVFDEVSKILDRRLYRYRQIVYAFRSEKSDRIERAFTEYREVLFEWNDNLNRNYARLEIYFGQDARHRLEHQINTDIIFIGTQLERIKNNSENAPTVDYVREKIDYVNGLVYDFDKSLLRKLENSDIGQFRTQSSSK